jgi:hypothetical protein
MRAPAALALLAYSVLLLGVAAVGVGVDGCAKAATDDYDGGYSPAPTGTSKNPSPESSTGDDENSPPVQGDEPNPSPPGDDAGEDAMGEDASDDGSDEAAAAPCTAGQTCVDQAPSGWTGYVQLRIAVADAGTGACGAPYGTTQLAGIADPAGPAAQCSPCTCGAPTAAVTCSSGFATANLGCTSPNTTFTALPNGSCVSATLANGATEAPTPSNAPTCATHGGELVGTPDASTSTPAVVCTLGTGDGGAAANTDAAASAGPTCSSTQACAAAIGSQAGPSGVCIYQSGVQTCPTGTVFTEQHLVGASVADTRGCACSCGPAQCPSDGVVQGFSTTGCTGTPTTTLDPGSACVVFYGAPSHFKFIQSKSDAGGTCDVDDAGPTGGVSVDTATGMTLCCIP